MLSAVRLPVRVAPMGPGSRSVLPARATRLAVSRTPSTTISRAAESATGWSRNAASVAWPAFGPDVAVRCTRYTPASADAEVLRGRAPDDG